MAKEEKNKEQFNNWDAAESISKSGGPVEDDNPFGTEFNSEDVVNRKKKKANKKHVVEDYSLSENFEEEINEDYEPYKKKQILSQNDIEQLMNMGDEARRAVEIHQKFAGDNAERESPIIKKEELKRKRITEEDVQNYLNFDEDTRKKLRFQDKYAQQEEDKLPFKDFIMAPRLAGSKLKPQYQNLMPSEYLQDRGKRVEIEDKLVEGGEDTPHKHSSVVINRDEYGDIESLEVFCKCGEHTLIKFDYFDESATKSPEVAGEGLTDSEIDTDIPSEGASEEDDDFLDAFSKKDDDAEVIDNEGDTEIVEEEVDDNLATTDNIEPDESDISELPDIDIEDEDIQDELQSKIANKLKDEKSEEEGSDNKD